MSETSWALRKAGFTIVGCKMMQLTPKILREHYAHVADKPFYPEIEKFMSSRPVDGAGAPRVTRS
jgi:nucleoside diphosphate kinase